eukprot:1080849-Amorphochlora_amoeboformis.AAC.2
MSQLPLRYGAPSSPVGKCAQALGRTLGLGACYSFVDKHMESTEHRPDGKACEDDEHAGD